MKHVATTAIAILWLMSPAGAAALKTTATACRTEADAIKVLDLLVKKDKAGLTRFTQAKIADGACTELGRGVMVTADLKRSPLSCVRRSGDLDCFWVASELVDLAPAAAPSPSAGGRRGGRHP